ncbi:hypothetical protein [Desulfovibrio ferrophilus]|uniref:Uncharacterized protein n=1 Tax=Desulfovibrio ferrophilus TaxID=241368 RepID=A0A2Z6AVT3_9BACT|nr:hypothetical protein [Desulfovibrio ferrophilus]BBD07341.1 uncharacterized protein DFE_0615 [Desulfovibrio ferrophilus]
MSAAENVHFIGENNEEQKAAVQPQAAEAVDKTSRDMGKVALLVAILSVVLLVVFFFGLNQNISGLSTRVDNLGVLKNDVDALGGRMNVVEDRLVTLEGLPLKAKKMVMGTMLQEMAQRAAYLSTQLDGEGQNARLQQAIELMQQVQVEVIQEAEIAPAVPATPVVDTPAIVVPEVETPAGQVPEAAAPAVESGQAE